MNRLFLLLLGAVTFVAHAQVPDYVPTEGLVGWYPFNGNANDESGNGHHGALNFDAALSSDRNGTSESAVYLDGYQDHFSTPPIFNSASDHSVVMWFELTNPNASTQTLYNTDPHNIESMTWNTYFLPEPGFSYCLSGGGGWDIVCGSNGAYYVDNDMSGWIQWAVSKSDLHWKFFLNGELVFETETMQNTYDNVVPLWFGAISGGSGPPNEEMNGTIDDIGIWDRALTENEILTLYLGQEVVVGCTDPIACNFNDEATWSDDTCEYGCLSCGSGTVWNDSLGQCLPSAAVCLDGTIWDADLGGCVPLDASCPQDLDFDGVVGVNDLMDLLSAFGTDCAPDEEPETNEFTCGDPAHFDGHDYATVQIGDQCWFAENLRTEHYTNGDAIPANFTDSEWSSTTSGAVAVYGEDAGCDDYSPDGDACDPEWSLNEFGRLYNWYAVDDERGLCPTGWHVPTDGEWMTLEMELGMSESVANSSGWRGTDQGTQMKTTYGWFDGGNGTNSSGFSGLPGGSRLTNGYFYYAGYGGGWWTSSPSGSGAWYRGLYFDSPNASRANYDVRYGFSVRCLQDAE